MYPRDQSFCDKHIFNWLNMASMMQYGGKRIKLYRMIDFDAQSDFGKKIVTKKLVPWDYSYLKYAVSLSQIILNEQSVTLFVIVL